MTGSYFQRVQQFKLDYAPITVTQYESSRTGMRVALASQEGPKVYGYFALATEIHDDSGSPHTLEHLCFMGSKSYRYKGVLDKLATRAYSNTNAWTANDHTAYTLETAGWEGFAQILPVYLEHVLLPTLTDAGCYTEVHHVDGTGNDAGVVYSEMQALENQQGSLMQLESMRLIYPEGNGFRYETGGMMDNLRVLTAERIRRFHRDMYQPRNLSVVLIGQIDHPQLLSILDKFESSILSDIPSVETPFKRPWVESDKTPPIAKTIIKRVEFPEEDESTGEIQIDFLGPDCNDILQNAAIRILLMYLTESSASVLENTLVEREQLCSAVYYAVYTKTDLSITCNLAAVRTSKLEEVEKRFFQVLRETASKELDMSYLHDCMKRSKRQQIYRCETHADTLSTDLIEDHIFGNRDGTDLRHLENFNEMDVLERWTDTQWRDFLRKWISEANHVSILGVPSKKLSDKVKAEETARVEAQQKKLGEEGLQRLAQKLEDAKAENDRPIPDSVLAQFKVPDTSSIHFIHTTSARAGLAKKMGRLENDIQKRIDTDDSDLPLFMHFEHIPSQFVRIKLCMGTGAVPTHLKPLLPLYMMNFFATPIKRDGKTIGFEQVVMDLERDTVGFGLRSGPSNTELLQVHFEVEPDKYATAVAWIKTMLYDFVFDEERLQASLTKILADIPDEKRDGSSMSSSVQNVVEFTRESSIKACDTLVKSKYLRRMKAAMRKDPNFVISRLQEIVDTMHQTDNYRIYVAADLEKLESPVSTWNSFLADLDATRPLRPLDDVKTMLTESGRNPGSNALIVPLPAVDSAYGRFSIRGPDSYDHPDLPAVLVAEAYLDAVEGPLWVAVRGSGLAYGAGFRRSIASGMLTLTFYRSPECFGAYLASKDQIEGLASGKIPLDKLALEGAISTIVQGYADEQPTAASAASVSFSNQVVRGIGKDWNDEMLKKVRDVSADQVKEMLNKYFTKVFDPAQSNLFITCAKIMEENLVSKFTQAGYKPQVLPLSHFEDDYGLEPVEGEDELSDDDDDDDDDDEEDGSDGGSDDEDGDDQGPDNE
ncbi:hypothetical protein K461DRAFT_317161 [Myriangium duriaei CBS 260.36]|uniref:Peptidase M16 C-terminal domain-containing protein n=1 Tax=Myriangium duriaei CBS 260.36 TaxID=1168546 RepID=A0A9P4JBG3_9PEZI|nr:hypothetical protein K461DRAFT_317161 [Myriangium duriaei CBS 260.36]